MSLARRLVPVIIAGLLAAAALAADEPSNQNPQPTAVRGQPTAIESSGAPGSGAVVVDPTVAVAAIPANAAEIEALSRGEMTLEQPVAADAGPSVDAARAARRAAFDAIVTTQQAKIQALTDRLASATGNEAVLEIQREITREKRATQRQLMELQLELATRDGDQARIDQMTAALTAWDAPQPALQPVDRPVPVNPGR